MAIEFVLDLELWLCKKKEREGKSLQKNPSDEHGDYDLENSTSNQVQTGLLFTPTKINKRNAPFPR